MPGGVPSQFQKNDPWPVYLDARRGRPGLGRRRQRVPRLPQRLRRDVRRPRQPGRSPPRSRRGWTRARTSPRPTEGSIIVAEELRRRWGLPHWRFTNSGTESTMDAIHLARGFTGRDMIVKIEGTYHGHHDAVMVSVKPPPDRDGRPRAAPNPRRPTASATRPAPPSTRASCRSTTPTRSRPLALDEPRGRRDHGAGDDEHQHRPAGRRLPRARARAHPRRTASC